LTPQRLDDGCNTRVHYFLFFFLLQCLDCVFDNMSGFTLQLVHAPAHVAAAPAQTTPSKVAQPTGAFNAGDDAGIDSDLQARLDNLRKM
jgi:hypothetical protein